jgi:hypothetical protein
MSKFVIKRVRIFKSDDDLLTKFGIKKTTFIRNAIIEKLSRDFKINQTPF